jgi:hypothetical protein
VIDDWIDSEQRRDLQSNSIDLSPPSASFSTGLGGKAKRQAASPGAAVPLQQPKRKRRHERSRFELGIGFYT